MTRNLLADKASRYTDNAGFLNRLARRLVLQQLGGIRQGRLLISDGLGEQAFGQPEKSATVTAEIRVHDPDAWRDILTGGSIGAGEAYMSGDWSSPDLTRVVRVMVLNRDLVDSMDGGLARLAKPFLKLLHRRNRNTEKGARRNIAAHYDLGNEFFSLFLDPTMMYSAGIFPTGDATMEAASRNKMDRICRKLELGAGDHLLEIGTGWGGLALHAALHYGCRVTTTTISREQYEYAREKIREAGLEDRVTLLLKDYRALEGRYDKLVSVEMIEAVGWQYYPEFFRTCSRLLKPEGLALIQAITIEDYRFERARKDVDFIQRYIFPGSCIPSLEKLQAAMATSSDLRLTSLEDITPHYATTLARWREAFLRNQEAISALGYSPEFRRMWEFYLCYCEGGFHERVIGDVQLTYAKPGNRSLPLTVAL